VINAEESFNSYLSSNLREVVIDRSIEPRYPYSFMVLFVKTVSEVNELTPMALHNLIADGILWYCFPKKSSKIYTPGLDRANGWKVLLDSGLRPVRQVTINDDWSALRFRNIKYIKSAPDNPRAV
jgi:hypothetical protein